MTWYGQMTARECCEEAARSRAADYVTAHNEFMRQLKSLGWKNKGLKQLPDDSHIARAIHKDGREIEGAGREEWDAINDLGAKIGIKVRLPAEQ